MCKREKKEITMRDPGVAAVLSAIIPGVGQFYNIDLVVHITDRA
jgi:hypothetical protein